MSVVVCKLPKAGLANQLFPLMHALIFAKLNQLPLIITGYHSIKLGPWIRREKRKRNYRGYFTFEKSWIAERADHRKVKRLTKTNELILEPDVIRLPQMELQNKLFIFSETGDYHDYFRRLKACRQEVIEMLYSIIQPSIIDKLNKKEAPVIGVHIRMGDFRKLKEGEKYESGHVRPPQSLFVDLINRIRQVNGKNLPVVLFSDGYRNGLSEILELNNTKLTDKNSDLIDLLLLSKSRIILPTHGSTFSAWACFLSDATILSFFNYPKSIRPPGLMEEIYEGTYDAYNEILREKLISI